MLLLEEDDATVDEDEPPPLEAAPEEDEEAAVPEEDDAEEPAAPEEDDAEDEADVDEDDEPSPSSVHPATHDTDTSTANVARFMEHLQAKGGAVHGACHGVRKGKGRPHNRLTENDAGTAVGRYRVARMKSPTGG